MQKTKMIKGAVEAILIKTNKSPSGLARELEMSPSYLSKILGGDRPPTPKFRAKLMDALGMEGEDAWDELFTVVDDIDESSQPMPV